VQHLLHYRNTTYHQPHTQYTLSCHTLHSRAVHHGTPVRRHSFPHQAYTLQSYLPPFLPHLDLLVGGQCCVYWQHHQLLPPLSPLSQLCRAFTQQSCQAVNLLLTRQEHEDVARGLINMDLWRGGGEARGGAS